MDSVLIIVYYWPPSGGAGVQRWLKLSKYLTKLGVKVHVITVHPDHASYIQWDESLLDDVHPDIQVHTTRSFEPINMYAKLAGREKVPAAGFSNVNNRSWKQKTVYFIRSNFFIPDPRRGWNRYAYRKAKEVIRKNNIKHVVTTSPPHSTQLIGLKLKRHFKSDIKWISDFRDPWTDVYYYELLQHSFVSDKINHYYERKVIEQSDSIITVGQLFKDSLLSKTTKVSADKIAIIPNGFDPEDFHMEPQKDPDTFVISYTGTISDHYQPEAFFISLAQLIKKYPEAPIRFRFVGLVSNNIKHFILEQIGDKAEFIPPVSHDEAIQYMLDADMLLLVTQGEKGTIPGKTFEYMASRNRIVCLGTGDAGEALVACNAGKAFARSQTEAITAYLEESLQDFFEKKENSINEEELLKFSREYQARLILEWCT